MLGDDDDKETMMAQTGFGATNCQYCGASTAGGHVCPKRPLDADVSDLGDTSGYVDADDPNNRYAGLEGTALQLARNCDSCKDDIVSLADGHPSDEELDDMGMTRFDWYDRYGGDPTDDELDEMGMTREDWDSQDHDDDPDGGTYERVRNYVDQSYGMRITVDRTVGRNGYEYPYHSAELLLAGGGPTIHFDTGTREVTGTWAGDAWTSYVPGGVPQMMDDYIEETWNER